jgi:acetyl-CoA decarbonylase/synthase complex subunit gamma
MTTWVEKGETADEIASWREAYLAALLVVHFADILILHGLKGWSLLPLVILRQNIYTDPRRPAAVEAGLKTIGTPNKDSPVMFTANFALTYYTVAHDIESGKIDAYLLVIDTEGIAVDSAVAGRKLTADKIAQAMKASGLADKVRHRRLIIPGKASRLGAEIEALSGWQVMVGPSDSSGIPRFLKEKWQVSA